MPDYANTVIYKIVCKDVNIKKSYGGHTTNIIKRRQKHKTDCNNKKGKGYNSYVYNFIRDHGNWENWDVVWHYDYPCQNKREAALEERKFIELNKCELNSIRPIVTKEEAKEYNKIYKEDNKQEISEYLKNYYVENKEQIKECQQNYYVENKEQIKEFQKIYNQDNKEQIKKYKKIYYESNKEQIKKGKKKYYEDNKEKNKKKNSEKFNCECGGKYTTCNKLRHLKSQKHQKYLEHKII